MNIYIITRIAHTDTDALLYQWSDGHSEQHPADWTGFYRGSTGGHDASGEYERQDGTDFHNPVDLVVGCFVAKGGVIEAYVEPDALTPPAEPTLFAAVAICITDGAISMIEQAAQLQGATYDDGWLMIWFAQSQDTADYLVFAQSDVPAKIEQFKDTTGFELVFSDANGDPLNPARIDIQILKVR